MRQLEAPGLLALAIRKERLERITCESATTPDRIAQMGGWVSPGDPR